MTGASRPPEGPTPILQFGTSRFLLAHADLFVSDAMARGEALGPITVVQTTSSPDSAQRIGALRGGRPYPVRIRGLVNGSPVERELEGHAVVQALSTHHDWEAVRRAAMAARVILSNTGDRGYDLDEADTADTVADRRVAPRSFPAKIAVLLRERWEMAPEAPLSIFPCELVSRNGDRLRAIVTELAGRFGFPPGFAEYLATRCRFANSLVDRIVSEPIAPVGAVAEPYALWAIERQEGLVLPCTHPAIVVTDDLARYEDLKLHLLNLGHTVLAELWLAGRRPEGETVREIMADPEVRDTLERVWRDEVLPVFAAAGLAEEARRYVDEVRDRFRNPFLAHRLADIANNHREKKARRFKPVVERNRTARAPVPQPVLAAMLNSRF